MSSSPERGGGPPAKPVVEGSQRRSGADVGPLHPAAQGPPPRSGEELRRLDDTTFVAPRQVTVADIPAAEAAGIRLIVNNRPDCEEPGQPSSAELEAAAGAAGLGYRHIPISGGFPAERVDAMAEALEQGPVLLFCRSGTRSTFLWALARASRGTVAATLIRAAAEAGYDLSPLAPYLTRRGSEAP
jgi:uncharacterized protein (TIGR01244 family)